MKQAKQSDKAVKPAKPAPENADGRIQTRWSLWARRLYREGKAPQTE